MYYFTSTLQTKSRAFFLNEIKPDNVFSGVGYAATININNDDVDVFNLYILDPVEDPNSCNIEQPTFSQGHDL